MKINYKNTALGLIDRPRTYNFAFPPNMFATQKEMTDQELRVFGRSILKNGDKLREMVGHNIQYVSDTFWRAYLKGKHKLKDIFCKEQIEEAGALILSSNRGPFTHTYYYFIKTYGTGDEWDYDILFMDFSKYTKNDEAHLDVYIDRNTRTETTRSAIWGQHLKDGLDNTHWESLILGFVLFKKYCDIETKIVEPKAKTIVSKNKYINETDKRIKILDSTWFTNLVISGAFEVEGHLHWYYYGPGKSQKKLQWVSTYNKQGYTRKAKALNQNTNE